LLRPDHPYVGRGGLKLAHALDAFGVAVEGREALDIGASTGGFTDVLLRRGAARVIALDVGHGQIDWRLRNDPRVVVIEGKNARYLAPGDIPGPVDVVVIDVSFISLAQILPRVPAVLREGGNVIALVKPQFEAGRDEVGKKGVVRDPEVHERVIARVTEAAGRVGLARAGLTPSPVTGAEGNQEFLLHLRAAPSPPERTRRTMVERVGIVAKIRLASVAPHLVEVAGWLAARGVEPVLEEDTAQLAPSLAGLRVATRDDLPHQVDLLLVLGGDGTLLTMADRVSQAGRDLPILGVNFGHLGFLTEINFPELYPLLESAISGTATIERRLILEARVLRGARCVAEYRALNDVVITRGSVSRVIELAVTVDGAFVARFTGDGLIIASPTGSTAYNLSAGGPILHPAVDALVLTPIAPHTLSNRPVVVPGTARVQVTAAAHDPDQEVILTLDGQLGLSLEPGDTVEAVQHDPPVRLVKAPTHSYFDVLRQKLKWVER
jgi:NAD+ kinase